MEQITNSYNLFVDSSRGLTNSDKGDDFEINLQDAGVTCGDGEFIRLNLDNFCMAKTFLDVNPNNNEFRIKNSESAQWNGNSNVANIPPKNYTSRNELADAFADALGTYIKINAVATGMSSATVAKTLVLPASTGSSDNIISFTLDFGTAHGLTAADTHLQFVYDKSDSYALLGGDRITELDTTSNSVTLTVPTTTSIKVQCLYPSLLSTTPYIYVRAPGVLNTNLSTVGFNHVTDNHSSMMTHSTILGRVPVDTEYLQYTASTGREFFLDVHQKQLNHLRLRLTDKHGRGLGRTKNANSLTAAGTGSNQATLGNLDFTAVIRIDIVKRKNVNYLESERTEPNLPARFSNGITLQQRFGKDTYKM